MVTPLESERLIVLACGLGAFAMALVLVVCTVSPSCPLHRLLPANARIRHFTPLVKRKLKGKKATAAEVEDGADENGNSGSELQQLKQATYVSYGHDLLLSVNDVVETPLGRPAHEQQRPTALATRENTVDSTYSSMTTTGSRPSTPVSCKSDPLDFSSMTDGVRSAETSPLYGSVTVSLQLSTTEDPATVRLLVGVQEAQDLPARDNLSCGDPFFHVVITREARAFRRSKSKPNVLAEFDTSTQRKTRHPIYNERFAKEIAKADIKDCVVQFAAFDRDKYANPTEFGEAVIALKNLNLSTQGQPVLFSLGLSEPKQKNGELQLSLMYLPTAERLAFSLFKVSNLKQVRAEAENCKIFIRVILLHNGKMVTKKKTGMVSVTSTPTFEESIAFDVPTEQIQNLSFVVVVTAVDSREIDASPPDSPTGQERCIGKVTLGPKARSTGMQHWELALQRPREQVTLWHVLR